MPQDFNLEDLQISDLVKSNMSLSTVTRMLNNINYQNPIVFPQEGLPEKLYKPIAGITLGTINETANLGKTVINFIGQAINYYKENRYCLIKKVAKLLKEGKDGSETIFILIENSRVKLTKESKEYCEVEYETVRSEDSIKGWVHKKDLIFSDN